jgi:hexokinase
MSRRVYNILEQLSPSKNGNPQLEDLKKDALIQSLKAQMLPSIDRLKEMTYYMLHEMHDGLQPGSKSTLKMLPSYVYKRSPTKSNGIVYALDLGGSNFRVLRLSIKNGDIAATQAKKFVIPENVITNGEGTQLFDFIATSIEDFLAAYNITEERKQPLRLGFTFSFPVEQHSIASGTLIHWTKEFKTRNVESKDVVVLLREAFARNNIAFKVVALCNDTVGTLITRYFTDETTTVGVILGTGSNACYFEQSRNIAKCGEAQNIKGPSEMVVNMEFGGFDSKYLVTLPATLFDNELDEASENKGSQRFEKMISGRYLGEIARRILVFLSQKQVLPAQVADRLAVAYAFKSETVGAIVADHHPGLWTVANVLKEFGIVNLSKGNLKNVQLSCRLVSERAAMLSGMAVAATLLKSNRQYDATVAVDGSVFEKQPYFKSTMDRTLKRILGNSDGVRLELTRDGSGLGAGCIAALQQ